MLSPISPADDSNPTETRRGRAWIDQTAGVRIGYTLAGISPGGSKTVLLIHGAPQTGHAWRKVVPTLVAAGYQVVVPDYRGAGASTKPRDGYDKWTMAGDLHDLLHNELGIEGPVSVVGHDLGSMVAFAYALRYRDDVVSLTTMEAPLPGTDYYEQRKVAKSAWHFDFHANPDIAVYLTHGRERWYITRFFDDLTCQPDAISEDDLDVYARAFEAPGAMRALCEIYRELDHDADIHRADLAAKESSPCPSLLRAEAHRPSPPTMHRCVGRSPSTSPDIWCPTPATGSPRRTLTTSAGCSSSSTPQSEQAEHALCRRPYDSPNAFSVLLERTHGRTMLA
jgi:pimeloyl-ACP methyl ester carboxylesterase